jgi:hypothetical protein
VSSMTGISSYSGGNIGTIVSNNDSGVHRTFGWFGIDNRLHPHGIVC